MQLSVYDIMIQVILVIVQFGWVYVLIYVIITSYSSIKVDLCHIN